MCIQFKKSHGVGAGVKFWELMPELPAGGSNVAKSQGPVLWSQFWPDNKYNLHLVTIHLAHQVPKTL